jgi:eukaryotic-like serine/threonine-protein kinase
MSIVGQTIGRYRITHQLGAGGMGIVYGAQDTLLGRGVAIKVLHPGVGGRQERVRRFSQEARAASALNHPNIVTVHDAGEFESGPFLVMELVEGDSLRAHLRSGRFTVAKILDIGVQTAAALARAHESGITHRDLKPENILVRLDSFVKILDFGLAKLKEQEPAPVGSETITLDAVLTSEGSIMGTAAYMSPEQASGRLVDSRSDIFSLALVLLECWQGKNPFRRENGLETLHAIVHDPAPALEYSVGSLEWDLSRILEKALKKDPDDRYQTMKDFAIDLRRLKQESETGRLTSSATAAGTRLRMPVNYRIPILILVATALGVVILLRPREATDAGPMEYTQLKSFADSATSPALSPDGRMLAFIRGESTFFGPGEIYVKLLPEGEPLQLTRDERSKMGPKFSPDGARIAYTVIDASGWSTWVVPVLGGQPRALLANAEGLTWIKGQNNPVRVLFSEMTGHGQQMGIVTATESRAEQRTVYMPPDESGMAHRSYLSPDGKEVLLILMKLGRWVSCGLTRFDGSSGVKEVGPSQAQCKDAAWSPDGKWMYFSADIGNRFHIWRQRYPDGVPEQITSGATQEEGIEIAPDGRSLVTSIGLSQSTLWIHDARGERQITSEGFALLPSISPDAKRLYYLQRAAGKSIVSGESAPLS